MSFKQMACLLVLVVSTTACGESLVDRAEKDDLYFAEKGDKDMEIAYQRAREGLDNFLATWRSPPAGYTDFSVKVGIAEGEDTEYFWLSPFREQEGSFVGTLNNEPRMVTSVQFGQEVSFTKDQIVDWLYHDQGRMVGNYTACAMLKQESEAEKRTFEQRYGLQCEA